MSPTSASRDWSEALRVYLRPRVVTMLLLGFSAGLPFMLVFGTLSAWLREADVSRTTIGFFSWIGITYSIKVLWAPIVDRLPLPVLTRRLGRRRGWMLAGQLGIAAGLLGMALTDPEGGLAWIAGFALLVAFSSATQDVAVDAFRIEAEESRFQGAMAASYQLGWRLGYLASYTGALYVADAVSWAFTYAVMAALMAVGVAAVLLNAEPVPGTDRGTALREARARAFIERNHRLPSWLRYAGAWLVGAVFCPIADFFGRFGRLALMVLLLVGAFRIADIAMGSMANPLYIDLGFSKSEIGMVSGLYGVGLTILGAFAGGVLITRYGILRPLLAGAVLTAATNLLFVWMAARGGSDVGILVLVIGAENFSGGLAGSAFIAWLSSLTSTAYTATQYALFSSLMTLPGKFLSGFGGMVVDTQGYPAFFLATALLGVPAILLVLVLIIHERGGAQPDASLATETGGRGERR